MTVPAIPSPRDAILSGRQAYNQGDYVKAERVFASAIKNSKCSHSDRLELLDHHIGALLKLKRFDECLNCAKSMIRHSRTDGRGYLRCGKLESLQGNYEAALKWYQHGIKNVPAKDPMHATLTTKLESTQLVIQREVYRTKLRDPLGCLPLEVAHLITSYLDFRTLVVAMRVSRGWKAFVTGLPIMSNTLDFSDARRQVQIKAYRAALRRLQTIPRKVVIFNFSSGAVISVVQSLGRWLESGTLEHFEILKYHCMDELSPPIDLFTTAIMSIKPISTNLKTVVFGSEASLGSHDMITLLTHCTKLTRACFGSVEPRDELGEHAWPPGYQQPFLRHLELRLNAVEDSEHLRILSISFFEPFHNLETLRCSSVIFASPATELHLQSPLKVVEFSKCVDVKLSELPPTLVELDLSDSISFHVVKSDIFGFASSIFETDDPPLPPLSTIFPHLEEDPHTLPPTLDPFTVTTTTGYLPCSPPVVHLPDDFAALTKILDDMPVQKLDGTPGLLATFSLGPLIDSGKLPDFTPYLDRLLRVNGELNMPLVTALFRDYSFLASSYVLEPCWESWCQDHNQGYGLGRAFLPKCIAGPLVHTAKILDIPPFMSYAASYALYNYYLEDPALGTSVYSNLRLVRAFEQGLDPKSSEAGFILTHIHMVEKTGPLIEGAVTLLKSIDNTSQPSSEGIATSVSAFQTMLTAMERIEASMETMWANSRPKDYISYRTFIFGITSQSMFPNGVVYEGENDNKPMYFRGESGANDSIIPLLDHILEIPMPKNPLTDILIDFRKYRPRPHREFLAYMMSKAAELGVRKYCTSNTDLAQLYLKLLDHVRSFRWRHWLFTREYIIKRSSHPTATGGSPIVTWLPNQLMAVMDAMDQVYKESGLQAMVAKGEDGTAFIKNLMENVIDQREKLDKEVKKYSSLSAFSYSNTLGASLTMSKRKASNSPSQTDIGTTPNSAKKPRPKFYDQTLYKDSSIEEQHGIILRTYYPPELTDERARQYATGRLERPIETLSQALSDTKEAREEVKVKDCVVHWFRADSRSIDNKALQLASQKANDSGVPLICVYLVSPQDFEAHLTAPVKVDFILRSLEALKHTLAESDIPLYVEEVAKRKTLPERLTKLCQEWGASHVYCNIEYEVDELRRDARVTKTLLQDGICFEAVHDSCVVQPGELTTNAGGQMSVYSPWYRKWIAYLNQHPNELDEYPKPERNHKTAREKYRELFESDIPVAPENRSLSNDEKEKFKSMWPAGEQEAHERLERFIKTKIATYHESRNIPAGNATSALSPYLAAGTISARTCVRRAKEASSKNNLSDDRKQGHSMWIGEVAWRDFYKHVLCYWPYVCMNKPFKPEYSNITWEYNAEHFDKWKEGKTGFPIVDAAMRQASQTGYMHNRCRMIVASFLAKDLLLDWRMGEQWFMEHLVDGDFASNNGGWGFSASCGVDPQPYFRIFNPLLQSTKFDPKGEYIRKWVPELEAVKGDAIHDPYGRGAAGVAKKNGYPRPIVDHKEARERCLDRYKTGLGRVNLETDRSRRGSSPANKYFHESTFHQHYDGRFANQKLRADLRLPQLTAMMQSFLSTMADLGAETWIMHGTLLGWWWNGKLLPWDSDIDVQVTEQTMGFLAKFYNMTEYHFTFPDNKDGVTYLLEINPHYKNGTTHDKFNVIDARWIDTQSGLFIDVSTVRPNNAARAQGIEGALIVKDKHHYLEKDLFPLRDGFFEGFHVKIPFDYEWLLVEEYGRKSLTLTTYEGHEGPKLPKQQLTILGICRFAEPVAMTSVYPYIPEMVQSFNVPTEKVAKWAGLLSAVFSLSQSLTGIAWGRASDLFGRKPIILIALTCTMISGLLFGFSPSLPWAFASRSMQGLSNGNVGIIRTAVAEIVPERELQPLAFSLMPLVWTVGSIFGPALGGSLVYPVERFPAIFKNSKLFEDYPFALPNVLISVLFMVSIISGFLFLNESLESRKHKRDYGILLGQLLTSPCTGRSKQKMVWNERDEIDALVPADEDQVSGSKPKPGKQTRPARSRPAWSQVFSRQSNINLVVYTFLAAHSVAADQLLPVFMHHPVQSIDDPAVHLPLKFAGGFGLDSERIGLMFMAYGIYGMVIQFALFPTAAARFGVLNCLKACSLTFPLVYVAMPFCALLPTSAWRQGIECVFPGPGRAPRKSRKPPDAELLARLKKLESVVNSLGANVDENGRLVGSSSPSATDAANHDICGSEGETGVLHGSSGKRSSLDRRLGRLIVSDDRSRYVSNLFWASMGDEIAEMRDLLDDAESTEDEEDSHESPAHEKLNSHQGFIFGYSSLMVDIKALHPTPSHIFILWEAFKDNIDPVVRLLHRPTIHEMFMKAASSLDRISRPAEALLFSLYLGAVISLTEEQCSKLLGESRDTLQKKYRFATEQALARADFLNSSSLVCLQAFTFFLICVRHMDETRLVWALGGMAVHLAQVLGIHRDGTHFGLTPFDTEMRRRLWWHISILDNRGAEDHGTDPTFNEEFYDTRLPLNINDEDIYPGIPEAPKEREGTTEMTFCLIRFDLIVFNRRLNLNHPGPGSGEQTLEEKEKMIAVCNRRIEDKYLRHCDMSKPIFWAAATVARLILAKMWLLVYHPRAIAMAQQGLVLPSETRNRLFITAVEVIEFAYILQTNENTAKWGWLFRTYMQWQSVAFVLAEICQRPPGPEVERAWRAVECVYDPIFSENTRSVKGLLWKPIRHLMIKARAIHGKQAQGANSEPSQTNTLAWDQDRWLVNRPYSNVVGASAEALGMDASSIIPPQHQSDQSAASGRTTAMRNVNDVLMADMVMSPDMNPDALNWNMSAPNFGSFNVEGEPELLLQFFQTVQHLWF
ncbi:hypothetical protein DV738_g3862, partial [Chaetothyriales sp. CBS 135597]